MSDRFLRFVATGKAYLSPACMRNAQPPAPQGNR
jgi:hypothetical protein